MTSKAEISTWFDEGVKSSNDFMIIVCDSFDYGDYPVYTKIDNFKDKYEEHDGKNMQRIMEVYDLKLDKETQMSEQRAFHYPPNFK